MSDVNGLIIDIVIHNEQENNLVLYCNVRNNNN